MKNKLAQEGHGGIHPTDPLVIPADFFRQLKVKGGRPAPVDLAPKQKKLYELIWRRTLASQMASAKLERVGGSLIVVYWVTHAVAAAMTANSSM